MQLLRLQMPMRLNKIGEKKCKSCGKEISEQDSESYDGLCWECWDDQLTEESISMFEELI